MTMPANTTYHFAQLRHESTVHEQQAWIKSIDIVHQNDPNLLVTAIFVAVDTNIIAEFSAWSRLDPSRDESWEALMTYLTTVRHPRNKPVDMVDNLLHLRPTGSIELFNENFRQLWQSTGGTEETPFGIGAYRALMPTGLCEILIRQEPATLSSAMQLCKSHIHSIIRAGANQYGEPMEIDALASVPFTELFKKRNNKAAAPKSRKERGLRNRLIDETRKCGIADSVYHTRMDNHQCVYCGDEKHRGNKCTQPVGNANEL
ncbi:hypothetical protein LPJ59_001282 [Coemansia sp. RSA 2399]|nr:hypothetical protein LPJ59_001282 [Coemansia sp. RSA 2399]KAJ1906837.1 hypothetical protein LPJ81_001121 [Coemansia sp. IMI 209127]